MKANSLKKRLFRSSNASSLTDSTTFRVCTFNSILTDDDGGEINDGDPYGQSLDTIDCVVDSNDSIHIIENTSMVELHYQNTKDEEENIIKNLIQSKPIDQTIAILRDGRFIRHRIEEFGAEYSSKVHISDFDLLRTRERNSDSNVNFDLHTVMLESFELFLRHTMEMYGTRPSIDAVPAIDRRSCKKLLLEYQCHDVDEIGVARPKQSYFECGKALLELGTFLHANVLGDDGALNFFRHALYLFLLEICPDPNEPHLQQVLLDQTETWDCILTNMETSISRCETCSSIAYKYIGITMMYIGASLWKKDDVDNALGAYKLSKKIWQQYSAQFTSEDREEAQHNQTDGEYIESVKALVTVHSRLGEILMALKGDIPAALKAFEEALELQIGIGSNIDVAKILHNIGVCHRHNDDYDEALECYNRAHTIFVEAAGRNHLDTVRTLHNIGGIYRRLEKYKKALLCFEEVLRVRRKILGEDHTSVKITLVSIAAVLRRSGRVKEAYTFYADAMR